MSLILEIILYYPVSFENIYIYLLKNKKNIILYAYI